MRHYNHYNHHIPREPNKRERDTAAQPRPVYGDYDDQATYRRHYQRWLYCHKIVVSWDEFEARASRAPRSVTYGSLQKMTTEQFQRTVERITRGELVLAITR